MLNSGILRQIKIKSNIPELLKSRLNPRVDIKKHLAIATKYYVEHKSTTKIAQEYRISASRVSDVLKFYRAKIAPLLVKIVNGEVVEE